MRLTNDSAGSTSSIGLAIAAAVMGGGIVLAQIMVGQGPAIDPRTALYEAEAATALQVIVRDAGRTMTGGAWALDADKLTRFGLSLPGQPNFIDYEKIKALRNGTLEDKPTNAAPDYPEVRRAIGITDKDFHLRTYPVIPGLDDPRWTKHQQGRTAYFAHYSAPTVPATITSGTALDANALNVSIAIRNDGTKDAVFTASISLADQGAKKDYVTEQRHTKLLAPGATASLWVRFDKLASWNSKIDAVHVYVTDAYQNVAVDTAGTTIGEFYLAAVPPTGSGNAHGLRVHAGSDYYVAGSTVSFWARDHDGNGNHVNNAEGRLVVVGPDGNEWTNASIGIPKNGYKHECTNCTMVGNYTTILWDKDVKLRQVDVVHVSALQMFTESVALDPLAIAEIATLVDLVDQFNPTRYDAATNPAGDVFGDDSNGPSDLTDVIARYATVVIGSEVKQTALTPSDTKRGIADWVTAGGNLIVLGTKKQVSQWLEPIYSAAQVNANGGIGAPDPTHPILSSPDRLDYARYLDRGRAWDIDKDEPFTHVLSRGTSGNSVQDTLSVSAPGSIGDGTVVLTSYMPGSLTDPQDPMEAKRFLNNLMSQSYTMLFLDYGPAIPDGVPVGSAQRLVAVPHPNVPGAVVEVRLVMYLFG